MVHKKILRGFVCLLFALLLGAPWLAAQGPVYKPGEYPAPRYPKIKAHYTVDDLMPIARDVVKRPYMNTFLNAGYGIQPGHRALLVVPGDFDRLVLEAIDRAIREAGGEADVVLTSVSDAELKPIEDGSAETRGILTPTVVDREGKPLVEPKGFNQRTIIRLAETGGYNILIYRSGGPHAPIKIPWQYIFWDRVDKFVTAANYPEEIQQAIEKAGWATMINSRRIHARDPEGTDIQWTVKPNYWEEAKKTYKMDVVIEGHISAIALGMDPSSLMEQDGEGMIGGTIDHTGAFPHIRMSVSKSNIGGMEGGGKYGELWRAALDKWKDVQWPGVPAKGISKLWEVAIGTKPNVIRPQDYMLRAGGNSWERTRSGVIHWGIGVLATFLYDIQMPKEYAEFRHEHGAVPEGHVHIHTYFTTMDIETLDGKKTQMINKGRLTALDDPKVRQIAAKYGDPDELLQEKWIPPIPGINVPGDYWKDYASNPTAYIRKDIDQHYKY